MGKVKLQGISGKFDGTQVKDLKKGDIIIWNFGYKSQVVETIPTKTGKQITVLLKSLDNGNILPRRMGSERLVVVQ